MMDWTKVACYLWDEAMRLSREATKDWGKKNLEMELGIKADVYRTFALAIFSGLSKDELAARGLFPFGDKSETRILPNNRRETKIVNFSERVICPINVGSSSSAHGRGQ
jgi:hypothetical protein